MHESWKVPGLLCCCVYTHDSEFILFIWPQFWDLKLHAHFSRGANAEEQILHSFFFCFSKQRNGISVFSSQQYNFRDLWPTSLKKKKPFLQWISNMAHCAAASEPNLTSSYIPDNYFAPQPKPPGTPPHPSYGKHTSTLCSSKRAPSPFCAKARVIGQSLVARSKHQRTNL